MSIPTLSPEKAKHLVETGGAVLVDIREAGEHARECIEGARSIPLGAMGEGCLPAGSGPVVFHCRSGMRTSANAPKLKSVAGGRECYLLDGGIDAWRKAGLGTRIDRKAPIDIMRQVQIAAGSLVLLGTLAGIFIAPAFLGVALFVGAGLTFAGLTGFCGMATLLSKMPWNRVSAAG